MTTRYVDDQVVRTPEGGPYRVEKRSGGNIYDGSFLSRKPRYKPDENWFDVIHWTGPTAIDQEIPALMKRRNIEIDFSSVAVEGRELLKLLTRNIDKATVDYGAYTISYFDPSRSYSLVTEEWYMEDDRLRLRFAYKLQEVIPNAWFPVEVDLKGYSLIDGKVYLHRLFALDLKRCSFNDPSALPEGIFEFSAAKEHDQLNDILQKYSNGAVADRTDDNVKGPLESVDNYVAAALAGDDQKAAEYAYPESAVAAQTRDTRELLQGQDIKIIAACISEWNTLAISSVIQADHGRVGPLVFLLKKAVLDQEIHWLIDDIDVEAFDTIEGQIKRFIERNPDSKTIMIRPEVMQPDRLTSNPTGEPVQSSTSGENQQKQTPDPNGPAVAESREAEVFGRVLQDGRNVAGARVIARIRSDQLSKLSSRPPELVARTDENGSYRFVDLPPGRYSISVMSQKGNLNMAQKQINLEPGVRTELNFGDEQGFTLTGVVTANGEAVEIASVMIQLPDESIKWGWTDRDGNFRITGVPSGRHQLFTTYDKDLDPVTFLWGKDGKQDYDALFDRRQITVENDLSVDIRLEDRSKKENPAVTSKSKSDKARSVKVELSVVEVFSDSKMDRETTVLIENLLGGKITISASPDIADLLRQASQATAAVKDESAGDKRVTQEQFNKLFDVLVSRGYLKILLRPTLEVVEGQTARIKTDQNSLEVTVGAVKDDSIDLQVQADLSSPVAADGNDQTPMFSKRSFSSRVRISPGQSLIIGGTMQPTVPAEPAGDAESSQPPGKELLCILTASITSPPADAKRQDPATPEDVTSALQTHMLAPNGVERVKAETLKEVGTGRAAVFIEMQLLSVSKSFLKRARVNTDSANDAEVWSKLRAVSSGSPLSAPGQILNDVQVQSILKAIGSDKSCKLLSKPQVLAEEGKKARIDIVKEDSFTLMPPNKPTGASGESMPKTESPQRGISIQLLPELREDKKTIRIECGLEIRRALTSKETESTPNSKDSGAGIETVTGIIRQSIPDGGTLLLDGGRSPFGPDLQDYDRLVILVKPTVRSQEQIKAPSPAGKEYEVVQLRYIAADEAAQRVTKVLSQLPDKKFWPSVPILPLEGGRQVIIFGNPDGREKVKRLLAEMDVFAPPPNEVVPERQITISGRCLDSNGQPLSDAQVQLYCRDSGQNSVTPVAQSRTDSEGRFRLGPITPPTEEDQGHKSYFVLVPANGHGPAWGAVNLYEETIEPLELTAHNSAAVSGRVVTEDSKPVAGAQVWVRGIISAEATDEPLSAVNRFSTHVPLPGWSATTDSDGSFRIAGIPDATRIQLFVSHRDFAGSIVHVKAGSHAKIIVQPGAAITGRVLYGKTGKPAAGVVVGVQGVEHISIPAGWMATGGLAVTDEQGRYRLESLPGGKYNVYPEAEDLTVVALDSFEVKPGEVREAPDLVLIEGGFIAGRVIDEATGKPVKPGQHSDVAIYGPSRPKSGAAVEISRIREDGSFRIRVAPGSNYIYLRPREDWGRGRINLRSPWVDVAEGQTVEVEFKVRKLSAEELEKERAPWQALNSYVPQTIDELENSANRLKQLGLAIAMYANEHDDTLPDGLQQLKGYVQDQEQLRWLLENVEYLGKGKTRQPNAARIPIAYDRTLLQRDYSDYSTEVLFLDCSVRFVGAPELGNLGITRAQHPTQTKPDAAIEGRVVYGTTGKPAAGVIVQAMEAEPWSTQDGMVLPWGRTVTDEQGRYRLESMDGAKYGIWVEAENLTAVALDSFQAKAGETREAPDLVLVEGGFIVGRVIDEGTSKPVKPGQYSDVAVRGPSRPKNGPEETFSIREDGSFRLRVAPGRNSVALRPRQDRSGAREYASLRSVSVTVDDGETVEVELRVRKLSKEEMEAQTRRQQEEPDAGGGRVVRFPDNKSLGSLHIRDDNTSWLSFKPWQPLCDAKGYVVVPPGKALLLDMTEKTNDIDFSSLAALGPQDLQALVVQRTRIDLPVVSRMNDLHWLLLAGSGTRDGDLASLIGLSKLERLDLTHTKITDIGVIHLAEVISLKDLTLSGTKITDESIPYLLELSRLERLDLRNTALTENGIKRIRKGLPNCRVQY